jgi:hypothetical protein
MSGSMALVVIWGIILAAVLVVVHDLWRRGVLTGEEPDDDWTDWTDWTDGQRTYPPPGITRHRHRGHAPAADDADDPDAA